MPLERGRLINVTTDIVGQVNLRVDTLDPTTLAQNMQMKKFLNYYTVADW